MKRLMMTAAALALLSATALADNVRTATMMSVAHFYDRDCAKIPGLEAMLKTMLAQLPADEVVAGLARGRDTYRTMSSKFCETPTSP
jgi:hypothetical protein